MIAAAWALAVVPLSVAATPRTAVDSVEARREAYACTSEPRGLAIPACRKALALGLSPRRAATVYLVLGLHLAALQRWDEVVSAYRAAARLSPEDADIHWRLGDALLYGLARAEEALAPLRAAVRLDGRLAGARLSLGVALNTTGAHSEAVASFEEALRLDPRILENRPAAREVLDASRRGQRWTP